jgi:hypothetical protein
VLAEAHAHEVMELHDGVMVAACCHGNDVALTIALAAVTLAKAISRLCDTQGICLKKHDETHAIPFFHSCERPAFFALGTNEA